MSEDEWNFVFVTEVLGRANRRSRSLSGTEHTFDTDDKVAQVWEDQVEKLLPVGFDFFVDFCFPLMVDDSDLQFTGVQVDASVVLVLLIVPFTPADRK
jgi:hypothetical protein